MAIRVSDWKVAFKEQDAHRPRTSGGRSSPTCACRSIYNLRADPFERGAESLEYDKWMVERMFAASCRRRPSWRSGSQSFKEFPIRQKPASFNLDEVMRKLSETKQ